MVTARIEWDIFTDDENIPHLIVKQNGQPRIATLEECQRAMRLLNEEGSNVIRLFCKNPLCKGAGGWIERSRKDAEKNIYWCDVCHGKMDR